MSEEKQMDFSAIATAYGVKCSDNKTLAKGCFAHQDGITVPMVYQHNHNSIDNVIGHCLLKEEDNGMRLYAYLNTDVPAGKTSKALIQHGDIKAVSIYAKNLRKNPYNKDLIEHGDIQEVSIVLAGANPKAKIDYIALEHSDGSVELDEDEAEIYNGYNIDEIKHEDVKVEENIDEKIEKENAEEVNEDKEEISHAAKDSELTDKEIDLIENIFKTISNEKFDKKEFNKLIEKLLELEPERIALIGNAIDELANMIDSEDKEAKHSLLDDILEKEYEQNQEELELAHSDLEDVKKSLTDEETDFFDEIISKAEQQGELSKTEINSYRDRYFQLSEKKRLFLDYMLNLVLNKGE